jgi:hypothetical protein
MMFLFSHELGIVLLGLMGPAFLAFPVQILLLQPGPDGRVRQVYPLALLERPLQARQRA